MLFHWSLDPLSLILVTSVHCFVWSLYLEVSSILVILVVLGSLTPISLMFCLWFRWILYLWSWLLLLLDFHCFVWSLLVSWGIFNFGCFGCVLGSLTSISLCFVFDFVGSVIFDLGYFCSWIFYCFIWSLLAPWGYFQFWLCSWIINMISLMFYLAILFLWFDFVPLDVISFLLTWFRGFFDLGAILSCDFVLWLRSFFYLIGSLTWTFIFLWALEQSSFSFFFSRFLVIFIFIFLYILCFRY